MKAKFNGAVKNIAEVEDTLKVITKREAWTLPVGTRDLSFDIALPKECNEIACAFMVHGGGYNSSTGCGIRNWATSGLGTAQAKITLNITLESARSASTDVFFLIVVFYK